MSEMLKLIKEERLNKSPQREKGKEDGEEDVGREREGRGVETVKTGLEFPKLLSPEQPDAAAEIG